MHQYSNEFIGSFTPDIVSNNAPQSLHNLVCQLVDGKTSSDPTDECRMIADLIQFNSRTVTTVRKVC